MKLNTIKSHCYMQNQNAEEKTLFNWFFCAKLITTTKIITSTIIEEEIKLVRTKNSKFMHLLTAQNILKIYLNL